MTANPAPAVESFDVDASTMATDQSRPHGTTEMGLLDHAGSDGPVVAAGPR